jgi:hypothetical protein
MYDNNELHPLEEKELKAQKKPWMKTRDIEKKPKYYKRYKDHPCPYCKKIHKSMGPYCSQSCANANREFTEQMRLKRSDRIKKYLRSPEGIVYKRVCFLGIKAEDYYIEIPL